jgi:hypothetical protein
MSRTVGGVFLIGLMLGGIGCTKPATRDKQAFDPLVMTKRPVEGKTHITEYHRASQVDIPPAPRPSGDPALTPATTVRLGALAPMPSEQ